MISLGSFCLECLIGGTVAVAVFVYTIVRNG